MKLFYKESKSRIRQEGILLLLFVMFVIFSVFELKLDFTKFIVWA